MVLHQMSTSSDQLYLRCRWEVLISGPDPLCKMVALSFLELGKQEPSWAIDGNVATKRFFEIPMSWSPWSFPTQYTVLWGNQEPSNPQSVVFKMFDLQPKLEIVASMHSSRVVGVMVVGLHFENMNLSLGNELRNTKNRLPGSTGAKFQA